MTSPRLALPLVLLLACDLDGVATFRLATGWTGPLPTWQGHCATASLTTDALAQRSDAFVAVRPGTVDLGCDKGVLRLEIRAPTSLALSPAAPRPAGKPTIVTAKASDGDGELDLGGAEVVWRVVDPVRVLDRCAMTCLEPHSVRIVADRAGTFPVTATFGQLTVTTLLTFE